MNIYEVLARIMCGADESEITYCVLFSKLVKLYLNFEFYCGTKCFNDSYLKLLKVAFNYYLPSDYYKIFLAVLNVSLVVS